jgi:hypothetical protein
MHTGFISFCDRVCNNIKSLDTKDVVLADLEARFGVQILQRHWHRLDEKGEAHVQRVPHMACLRSNGNPYYFYITRYEDIPIIFYVDKKVQPGYQKPRMILGRGKWSEELADGTLLDGEMVKDTNGKWLFLINDIIGYKGKHLGNQHLPERLKLMSHILDSMYTADDTLDVCRYEVKHYVNSGKEDTDALIELSKQLQYTNRGVYYWPYSLKYKPKLHNFDESLIKAVHVKVKDNPEFRATQTSVVTPPATSTLNAAPAPDSPTPPSRSPTLPRPPSPHAQAQAQDPMTDRMTLWLRKTEFPDVYDLYPTDNGVHHGNKLGIAYVKTLEDSRALHEVFKTTTVAMYIPFACVRDKNNKWRPVITH